MKTYYIKELKAEIEAKDNIDFEVKKNKLLSRNKRILTGGRSIKTYPTKYH